MPRKPSTRDPRANATPDLGQRQRFIETARELGCEENLGRFDEAVRRIGNARRSPGEAKAVDTAKDEPPT